MIKVVTPNASKLHDSPGPHGRSEESEARCKGEWSGNLNEARSQFPDLVYQKFSSEV
ncbi:MAG: hypothetical protein QXN22_03495 [Thermofilaceae archaeon]